MKKILPWLLLLLLLIIFCVSSKKDSIHISSTTDKQTVAKSIETPQIHYIDYIITQDANSYVLNGNFTNDTQQKLLSQTCTDNRKNLRIENTSTNQTYLGNDAIGLTNKILPHFIKHYENGKIVYEDQVLRIYGNVDSYEAQHEMQRLLNTTTLASQDNSNVIAQKAISYVISKDLNQINFTGTFENRQQAKALQSKLPKSTTLKLSSAKNRIDNGSIAVSSSILPSFLKKYTHGKIEYNDEVLHVSGMVRTQNDLNSMNSLLSQSKITIKNHTIIDPEEIAKAKALKAAKLKAIAEAKAKAEKLAAEKAASQKLKLIQEEAAKKAKAEAEKLAQQEAAKKAKAEAEAKILAQQEAAKKAKAEAEAKILAQQKAAKKAKAEAEKLAQEKAQAVKKYKAEQASARKNIIKLLQIQNIEFEVAKGSLTPRGKGTVDKLANILKQYPHINIEIAGHTDSDGSATFNQKLSQSRVDTVQKRLITKGVQSNRLTAKGYGESQPLVPNTSDANKQKNRRVEINIQGE